MNEEKIIRILVEVSGLPQEEIRPESRLVGDLGMSSFDLADAVSLAEDEFSFQIPDERFRELETVSDVLRVIREEQQS